MRKYDRAFEGNDMLELRTSLQSDFGDISDATGKLNLSISGAEF
jgi:hypothetical protein